MKHCNKYQNEQNLSLPSGSDILPIYWSCRARVIYKLPINLRYIHKSCSTTEHPSYPYSKGIFWDQIWDPKLKKMDEMDPLGFLATTKRTHTRSYSGYMSPTLLDHLTSVGTKSTPPPRGDQRPQGPPKMPWRSLKGPKNPDRTGCWKFGLKWDLG